VIGRTTATASACLVAAVLAVSGCRTARQEPRDVPAVILSPTAASRAALAAAVGEALGGARVTLADDALTRSSTLTVERGRHHDPAGTPAGGRELDPTERFRLVARGGACLLVHERTGRTIPLESTRCAPGAD
jgi:hypothetical protein